MPAAVGQRARRGHRLRHRADAADARHDRPAHRAARLPCRICSKPRYMGALTLGRGHAAVGDVELDFEVALDAVERADDQAAHGCSLRAASCEQRASPPGGRPSRCSSRAWAWRSWTARPAPRTRPWACRWAGRSGMPATLGVWWKAMAGLLEARLGAADAGVAAARAGAFAVPQADVAVGMRLRALAAHVFHQAAQVGRLLGAGLELVVLVARAAVVHQLVGVEARPRPAGRGRLRRSASAASAISVSITQPGCVGQPATLITGRPPRARKSAPSRPPGRSSSYCRPQASVGLLPPAVMPPQAAQLPTATTCVRQRRELAHPVDHRHAGAGQHVEAPGAVAGRAAASLRRTARRAAVPPLSTRVCSSAITSFAARHATARDATAG